MEWISSLFLISLWSEKQNILRQHMHKKEFGILTNKCRNNLKHEMRLRSHGLSASFSCLVLFHIYWSKSKIFFMHVLKKDVLLL